MQYGYREGVRRLVLKALDADTAAVSVNDIMTVGTTGYLKQAAAGDPVYGVAAQASESPAADGDLSILVDISEDAIYEFPPDSGSVSQALVGTTMDVGGPQSADIDASANDDVKCVRVDTDRNTLFVQLSITYTGVV